MDRTRFAPGRYGVVQRLLKPPERYTAIWKKVFIRAEVMAYDDLMTYGSVAEVRAKGRLRLEGKQYIVQDGHLLTIRFNI